MKSEIRLEEIRLESGMVLAWVGWNAEVVTAVIQRDPALHIPRDPSSYMDPDEVDEDDLEIADRCVAFWRNKSVWVADVCQHTVQFSPYAYQHKARTFRVGPLYGETVADVCRSAPSCMRLSPGTPVTVITPCLPVHQQCGRYANMTVDSIRAEIEAGGLEQEFSRVVEEYYASTTATDPKWEAQCALIHADSARCHLRRRTDERAYQLDELLSHPDLCRDAAQEILGDQPWISCDPWLTACYLRGRADV